MENKLYYTILRWRNRPTRTDRKWQSKVFKRADFIWWKRALKAPRVYDSPQERGQSGAARSPAQAFFKNRGDRHPRARLTGAPQLDPGTPGDHHGAVSLNVSLLLRLMVLLWRPSARPQPNTPGKATATHPSPRLGAGGDRRHRYTQAEKLHYCFHAPHKALRNFIFPQEGETDTGDATTVANTIKEEDSLLVLALTL